MQLFLCFGADERRERKSKKGRKKEKEFKIEIERESNK